MVNYKELRVADPLAYVFERKGLNSISYIISISAVIATASVLLIFQIGQPRIFMSMSRDGLLPKAFSRIHPKYKTTGVATIVTGIFVAIPALFMNLTEVTDLTSIGTLFAFVLVCGGVLVLGESKDDRRGKFRIPYINSKYIVPGLWIAGIFVFIEPVKSLFENVNDWDVFKHNIPYLIFLLLSFGLAILCFIKSFSIIPVFGLLSCLYLMTELGYVNWLRLLIWLAVGLVIYFSYGYKHSKLRKTYTATE